MNYDDETLMAYADGELDAAQRAEIAAAMENDPGLARRVEKHRALRAQVAGAFVSVLDQPVPERLVAAAHGDAVAATTERAPRRGKVLQFPSKGGRSPGVGWGKREWGAMAASVVLRYSSPGGFSDPVNRISWWQAAAHWWRAERSRPRSTGNWPAISGAKNRCRSVSRSSREKEITAAVSRCPRRGPPGSPAAPPASGRSPRRRWRRFRRGPVQQAAAAMPAVVLAAIESRIAGEALDAAGEENARLGGWDAK